MVPSKWDDEDDGDEPSLGCLLWVVLFILIFLFFWTLDAAVPQWLRP